MYILVQLSNKSENVVNPSFFHWAHFMSVIFPLQAILAVDHSVVDLETIEALYENVGTTTDFTAA